MISTVYVVGVGPANNKAVMETAEARKRQAAVDTECTSIRKKKVLTFVD